jgi:iron-sulfur cluster assembly protein
MTQLIVSEALAHRLKAKGGKYHIQLSKAGCSGWMFSLEEGCRSDDQCTSIEMDGMFFSVEKKNVPFVEGLVISLKQQGLNENIVFESPLATQSCGCGMSLYFGKEM